MRVLDGIHSGAASSGSRIGPPPRSRLAARSGCRLVRPADRFATPVEAGRHADEDRGEAVRQEVDEAVGATEPAGRLAEAPDDDQDDDEGSEPRQREIDSGEAAPRPEDA